MRESINRKFRHWRIWIISLTGVLAVLNLLIAYATPAALDPALNIAFWLLLSRYLPIATALFAAIVAIFATLEGFHKYRDRAQSFHEVRDLLLDAKEEYTMLWQVCVDPFGKEPAACINASRLYKNIVVKDRDLRSAVKKLTTFEDAGR